LDDFGEVQGLAAGRLGDLFPATEAIGDDEAIGRGAANRG
jgi:hypothetical protein